MQRRLALIAAISVSAVLSLGIRVPRCAAQAPLLEFSDESLGFANEISTNVSVLPNFPAPLVNPLGGTQIYSKTFFKTVGVRSIKINWNCAGDDHGGVSEGLRAQLDGEDCNPPGTAASALPDGWTAVEKHFNYETSYLLPDEVTSLFGLGDGGNGGNGDMHDNVCTYSWCCPVAHASGMHTVTVRMGNSCGTTLTPTCDSSIDTTVFEEHVHVEIDGSNLLCERGHPR